jgi:hypothetical protein
MLQLRKRLNRLPQYPERSKDYYEYMNILDWIYLSLLNGEPPEGVYEKARAVAQEKRIPVAHIAKVEESLGPEVRLDYSEEGLDRAAPEFAPLCAFLRKLYPAVPDEEISRCAQRYIAIGCFHGQHWSPHSRLFADQIGALGLTLEGFASPINTVTVRPWIREKTEMREFCSLFSAADAPFGSRGDFFARKGLDRAYVCPPYVLPVLERVPAALAGMKTGIVITPDWADADRDAPGHVASKGTWYGELKRMGFEVTVYKDLKHQRVAYDPKRRVVEVQDFEPHFRTAVWTKKG